MRKSGAYFTFLAICTFLLSAVFLHAVQLKNAHNAAVLKSADIAGSLGLTDLCLTTEARYTRHLSASDRFSAFQDHPASMEHYPSGSYAPPPKHIRTKGP